MFIIIIKLNLIIFIYKIDFTLIKDTGYSGKADATALAPKIFVLIDKPTKNSRPKIIKK